MNMSFTGIRGKDGTLYPIEQMINIGHLNTNSQVYTNIVTFENVDGTKNNEAELHVWIRGDHSRIQEIRNMMAEKAWYIASTPFPKAKKEEPVQLFQKEGRDVGF